MRYDSKVLVDRLNDLLSEHEDVDLIFFDTQLAGQILLYQKFGKPCILSLADIYESQIRLQMQQTGWRPYCLVYLTEWLKTAIYEYRILVRFQNIVTVSTEERKLISRRAHWAQVKLFSNGVDTTYYSPSADNRYSKECNKILVFVGSFAYAPNVQGFFNFYENILPLIRQKYPEIKFIAVGRNPTDTMKRIAEEDPTVFVTGTVQDVRSYYSQSSVVVIPLLVGSGTKLKTLEALAMGVPIVSTRVGSQGIDIKDKEHLLIADNPADFAEKVIWLLENPEQAQMMVRKGRLLVERCYDWREIVIQLDEYIHQFASG